MYYSYNCPYCSKVFYIFNDDKAEAAKELFAGLKKHQLEYGEDKKDTTLEKYDPEVETNMIYSSAAGTAEIPSGGNPIE
jgi:hypothetical protein